jgi:hypothetical protein
VVLHDLNGAQRTMKGRLMNIRYWGTTTIVVILATLGFMAATQLVQIMTIKGLTLYGLRTDTPTILNIEACDKVINVPRTFLNTGRKMNLYRFGIPVCQNENAPMEVTVTVTAQSGKRLFLLVNGAVVDDRWTDKPTATFNVTLHQGRNLIAVTSDAASVDSLRFQESRPINTQHTMLGRLWDPTAGAPIAIDFGKADESWEIVSQWKHEDGFVQLLSGPPSTDIDAGDGNYIRFDDSGYALRTQQLSIGQSLPSAEVFNRSASVERFADNRLKISLNACVPHRNSLAKWARDGLLTPAEFTWRVVGVYVNIDRNPVGKYSESIGFKINRDCTEIHSVLEIPAGYFATTGSFPRLLHDGLTLINFPALSKSVPLPRDFSQGETTVLYKGLGTQNSNAEIRPDWDAWNTIRSEPTRTTRNDGLVSPVAAAWARAEADFPDWIRAILSGLAGIAPILLLMWTVRYHPASRFGVLRGMRVALPSIYTLIVLNITIISQPFFFHIFRYYAQMTDFWFIVRETRADNSYPYLNPFTSAAIAVACMLVPVLRSFKARNPAEPRLLLSLLSLTLVTCGVLALVGLLALELSPQYETKPYIVALMNDLIVRAGLYNDYRVRIAVLAALVFAIGILTSAVALSCIFRRFSNGGRVFFAAMLASSLAIVLPLISYGVEASRVIFADADPGFSFYGSPAVLSSLGVAVLPYAMFLILLVAFREISLNMFPEAFA